jgi:hypothetical protein
MAGLSYMVDLPSNLIESVAAQNAVLFLGAGASYGASHPKGYAIPSGNALRDMIADRFLGGQLKDRSLAQVAELAINESSLIVLQGFVRDIFKDFRPAEFHRLIPTFRWHGIATTNFDMVIDTVYAEYGDPVQNIVPFVKNGQPIETEMKKFFNPLAYLKLHGSIGNYSDLEIPFILATEQYVRYNSNRTRLFERLRDWGSEFPIIFVGYSINDPNIQNILFDLFDLKRRRPAYYVVSPVISEIEERYWSSHRIFSVRATFDEFLSELDKAIAPHARRLSAKLGGGSTSLRTHYRVAGVNESNALLSARSRQIHGLLRGAVCGRAEA